MLSLSRLLTKNVNLTVSGMRSIYSAQYFGIDVFEKHCKATQEKVGHKLESIKKNLRETLNKSDGKIFVEDLKSALYCSKTDADLDLVKSSIERYNKQEKIEIFNFNVPLIKLLYTLNKTDTALDLFMNDSEILGKSFKVFVMLMNKLLVEKRYDDVIRVFNKNAESVFKSKPEQTGGAIQVLSLVSHALYEKNDLDQMKNLMKKCYDSNLKPSIQMYVAYFLLCTQQNQLELAKEVAFGNMEQSVVKSNFQIISLLMSSNENLKEAIGTAKSLMDLNPMKTNRLIFKESFQLIQKAMKETNNNESSQLFSGIKEEELTSLKDRLTRVIESSLKQQNAQKLEFSNRNTFKPNNFKQPQRFSAPPKRTV